MGKNWVDVLGIGENDSGAFSVMGGSIAPILWTAARQSDLFVVSADMNTYIQGMATALGERVPFEITCGPYKAGTVFLDEPLEVIDAHQKTLRWWILTWNVVDLAVSGENIPPNTHTLGVAVAMYADYWDPEDKFSIDLRGKETKGEQLPRWQLSHFQTLIPNQVALHRIMGEDFPDPIPTWLMSLWAVLNDPPSVTTVAEPPVKRAERRRAERLGTLRPIKVVNLTKRATMSVSENPTSGPSFRLRHRVIVRGHWRNQAYGPRRSLRRRIWVDEYVKGPDDAPLVVRPTVYRVGNARRGSGAPNA